MNKNLVIAGASGFGREVAWVVKRMDPAIEIVGFCDDNPEKDDFIKDIAPYLGCVQETLASYSDYSFFCAIGNNQARKKISSLFLEANVEVSTIIDPDSVLAPGVVVGTGSFIGINSVISVDCKIGCGVIVNHNVTVGHGVQILDYAQICPGACISGGCKIGEGALLGTLAGTIPLKCVGNWATVGAGVVAVRDVPDGTSMIRLVASSSKSDMSS